ncbi:MAG: peptide-methionine (S)-S-oxide reductase MsrA [Pseudomonadota bacterium]
MKKPLFSLFSAVAVAVLLSLGAGAHGLLAAEDETTSTQDPGPKNLATATFAGGCFWCVESDFDQIPGVVETVSGYTGGTLENPTYKKVGTGGTGHREAVKITFDPNVVSYDALLSAFWRSIDPTDEGGQFCDRGETYTTAVFVHDQSQRAAAEASRAHAEEDLGQTIVTPIEDAAVFYDAEDYHQNYYKKNPVRYKFYRWNCGRNQQVESLWQDQAYAGIPTH